MRAPVLRPRLLAVLAGRFERQVTALVAGPGFGKSTLLEQAVSENRLQPRGVDVLVRCTPDELTVSVLTAGLLGGLDAPAGIVTGRPDRRWSAADPDLPTDPALAARLVVDSVWRLAPAEVALILDDAQELQPGSPGQQFVARLIADLPSNGHLVLASRPALPWPLTRLIAAGSAVLLQEADLAMDADELAAFAAHRGVAEDLLGGISGWPALAELIAVTGRRQVVDYLWEEVLADLDGPRQDLLTVLALVGGADDELMAELLGSPVDLARDVGHLPLVSGDDAGWWSLHPLWESALRPRRQRAEVIGAARAAGPALRRRGLLRPAMRLLLVTESWEEVKDLLVQVCAGVTPSVPVDVLRQWQEQLPPEVLTSPQGRLLSATIGKNEDPLRAASTLAAVSAEFRAAGDVRAEMASLLSEFHLAFWRNDVATMRPVLARWRDLGDSGVADARVLGVLARALMADDPVTAGAELAALEELPTGPVRSLAEWLRGNLLLLTLGEPAQAAVIARRLLPRAPVTLRSSVRCDLVEALRLTGEHDEAATQAQGLLADVGQSVHRSPRHLLTLVVLEAFRGHHEEAAGRLSRLRQATTGSAIPWAPLVEAIGSAAVAACLGDEERAAGELTAVAGHPLARPMALLRLCPAALPLQYVLVAESRPRWDEIPLRGSHALVRAACQGLVAIRSGAGPAALAHLDDDGLRRAGHQLPVPWATLLSACLACRPGVPVDELVLALGPAARPTLRVVEGHPDAELARSARRLLALVPARPTDVLQVNVLGPLAVLRNGVEVDDPHLRRERVRQLLGFLTVHRSATRHAAATALWGELEDPVAARNLRVTLNYLQQVLEPDRDDRDPPFFLRARGSQLELATDAALGVDLWRFHRLLADAEQAERQGTPSLALQANLDAVALCRGDLLADLPADEWSTADRDRVRRQVAAAAVRAGQLLLARGDRERPEDLALRALTSEPWSEAAYQLLVAVHLARGDRTAAWRALDRCFDMLSDLGVAASAQTVALAEQVRRGAPARSPE